MHGGDERGDGGLTGSSSWAETQGAIVASCGGEMLEESSGDKKLASVPGRKPKDISETIIAVVKGGDREDVGEGGDGGGGGGWSLDGKGIDCY